ncbi:PACE efflux transporter [Thiomonas intermedia]|uniref:PACE efflux transporter n=1 Tax=Thiomonas intermedia TaxID=926 RepID=UPI0031843365
MPDKSPHERVLQAIGFEVLAILLSTPLFAWVMGTPWLQMGVLTVANSLIAVVWNVIFNATFDRYANRHALHLGWVWRVAHAALFEGGCS